MNKGFFNIIMVLAALLVLGGCSTVPAQPLSDNHENRDTPIMSAAEVKSMIRVEIRALDPGSVDQTIVASTD